jgi:hypothetical protein
MIAQILAMAALTYDLTLIRSPLRTLRPLREVKPTSVIGLHLNP